MTEQISAIMPTYNGARTLERGIRSVLEQTHENFELIVVNDGSTDDTPKIVDRLAQEDPRLVVVHQSNSGVSAARNTGLDLAAGSFVTFVDSDDTLPSEAFKTLLTHVDSGCELVVGGFRTNLRSNIPSVRKPTAVSQSGLSAALAMLYSEGITSSVWAKLYSRTLIGTLRFETTLQVAEDLQFNWHAFQRASRVCVIPDTVYEYHENPDSVTRQEVTPTSLQVLQVLEGLPRDGRPSHADVAVASRSFVEALQILTRLSRADLSTKSKIVGRCVRVIEQSRAQAARDPRLPWTMRSLAAASVLSPCVSNIAYRTMRKVGTQLVRDSA